MLPLYQLVRRIIALREQGRAQITLLAVCPNSEAVLEAAVRVSALNNAPMLFAATLNQVDRDDGYTGWTPAEFVSRIRRFATKYDWNGPLYPCLDHGGPWLKDSHTTLHLSLEQTMAEVKHSITACLAAGYQLLHIDPTVDRTLDPKRLMPIDLVVARTLDLIEYTEAERVRLGLPPISYEVGTEEVHGGLVNLGDFNRFVSGLKRGLNERQMQTAWPCFIVGKVGTDLHTTYFDPESARHLLRVVAPLGSLVKGHYTDWVENPQMYPACGMGGANVGPEFTTEEYRALVDLCAKEEDLCRSRNKMEPSRFLEVLEQAVVHSGRWKKWLLADELSTPFADLKPERRTWLVQTGARYVWTAPSVTTAREVLYENLRHVLPDPHQVVVQRVSAAMEKYVIAFHLFDANTLLQSSTP